ncbi:MAG: glucosaminidase domain-containing protein [Deltaproteobacteria bacterium]|nr:glucosaminidase domain-containing protein [Deltaproteobacteria bacterium]
MVTIIIWLNPEVGEVTKEAIKTEEKTATKKAEKKVVSGTSVQEKKRRFTETITPPVHRVYTDLMQQYQEAVELIQATVDSEQLKTLKIKYKATTDEELLMALKPHPQSITIAQAAMESSWATSRFFKEANNIFGVWSFNKNDQRIAAAKSREGKTIWLKKYNSIEDSIRDYYKTLATGRAYKEFRALKMKTNDPYKLVKKLDHYSEKGAEYGRELAEIIHFNKLETYDQPQDTEVKGQPDHPSAL